MSAGRRAAPAGAPSYDEEEYWEKKFKTSDEDFEWLGSGDILLDAFRRNFHKEFKQTSPPRILQLGAGTSRLSLDVARFLLRSGVYSESNDSFNRCLARILNVDFSQTALQIGERRAYEQGLQGMQYIRLDLRSWKEIATCQILQESPINFILDKSTSDAISTNEDVNFSETQSSEESTCPLIVQSLMKATAKQARIDPLDLVAIHMAAISSPECVWAVLSYSSARFDFLKEKTSLAGQYWKIAERQAIEAPSGTTLPGSPLIHHWFYLLQRQTSSSPV